MTINRLISPTLALALLVGAASANAAGNLLYVLSNNVGENENSVIAYQRQAMAL